MEEYVKFKIEYCVNMINIYANQKGEGAKEQWSYWAGQLVAWQQALEHIRRTKKSRIAQSSDPAYFCKNISKKH